MAKISAHGKELDRREYASFRLAVFEDGHILKNAGSGWKLYRKVKPGVNVVQYALDCRRRYNERPEEFHRYIAALQDVGSREKRWMLHTAITMMPEDPERVWSEMTDHAGSYGDSYDLEDIVRPCRAYMAFLRAFPAKNADTLVSPVAEVSK